MRAMAQGRLIADKWKYNSSSAPFPVDTHPMKISASNPRNEPGDLLYRGNDQGFLTASGCSDILITGLTQGPPSERVERVSRPTPGSASHVKDYMEPKKCRNKSLTSRSSSR